MFYYFLFLLIVFGISKADENSCGISPSIERYKIFNPNRIFGGENSNEGDFPWYIWMQTNRSGCSGSIVHEKWILTAAHCVYGTSLNITIHYGSVHWDIMKTKKINSIQYFVHPEYTVPGYFNDIALIELNGTLEFSELVQAVCLDSKVDAYPNEIVTQIGMGSGFKKMIDEQNSTRFPQFILQDGPIQNKNCPEEREICLGGVNHSALPGDSGAPLMAIRENRWVQIGVDSTGKLKRVDDENISARGNDFYMKVSYYCDWIKETTNNEVQC